MFDDEGRLDESNPLVLALIDNVLKFTDKEMHLLHGADVFNGVDAAALARIKIDAVVKDFKEGRLVMQVRDEDGKFVLDENKRNITIPVTEQSFTIELLEKKAKGRVSAFLRKHPLTLDHPFAMPSYIKTPEEVYEIQIAQQIKTEIILRTCKECWRKKNPIVRTLPIFMARTGISSPSVLAAIGYLHWHCIKPTFDFITGQLKVDSSYLEKREAMLSLLDRLRTTYDNPLGDTRNSIIKKLEKAKAEVKTIKIAVIMDVMACSYAEAVKIADAFGSCLIESQSEDRRSRKS
ncbi:MAG: hypothetical protein MI864_24965 [Pseudomonadales bacterium]|nr:hypothetical protein [Pseudomonadales bacterium]